MSTMNSERSVTSSHTTIISTSTSKERPKSVSTVQRLLWLGNLLYYQVVAVLTAVMLWVFFVNTKFTSLMLWHMVCCTVAYVPLMAVAIISFSQDNLPTLYISRTRIYAIHGFLLTISCLAVTIGISVEIHSKNDRGMEHFATVHARLGLISWILVLWAVCVGIVAAKTQNFARYIRPVVAKLLHNILGITAFVLGVFAIMWMFHSRHYKSNLSTSAYRASYVAAGYIIIWSLLAAFKSLYFQIKSVFS